MAALTVSERVLQRDLARAVDEWGRGLRAAQTSEDLRLVIDQIAHVARAAAAGELGSIPPPAWPVELPELERANERLGRLLGKGRT